MAVEEMVDMRRKSARWPRRGYEVILLVYFRRQVKKCQCVCMRGGRFEFESFGCFPIGRVVLTAYSCIWWYFVGLGSTWRSLAFDFRLTTFHV